MFKNIDTSHLTPEQLANAEDMAEYTRSHECKQSFRVVSLAEDLLAAILESDSRPAPCEAFALALKYAEHATHQGEVYMQAEFEKWRAARPAPAPAIDEVGDLDDPHGSDPLERDADDFAGATELQQVLADAKEYPENTITRDDAIADTERRAQIESAAATHPPHTTPDATGNLDDRR